MTYRDESYMIALPPSCCVILRRPSMHLYPVPQDHERSFQVFSFVKRYLEHHFLIKT
jgi:hypothetical protein